MVFVRVFFVAQPRPTKTRVRSWKGTYFDLGGEGAELAVSAADLAAKSLDLESANELADDPELAELSGATTGGAIDSKYAGSNGNM